MLVVLNFHVATRGEKCEYENGLVLANILRDRGFDGNIFLHSNIDLSELLSEDVIGVTAFWPKPATMAGIMEVIEIDQFAK